MYYYVYIIIHYGNVIMYNSVCFHLSVICVCISRIQCMLEHCCIGLYPSGIYIQQHGYPKFWIGHGNFITLFLQIHGNSDTVHVFKNPNRNM